MRVSEEAPLVRVLVGARESAERPAARHEREVQLGKLHLPIGERVERLAARRTRSRRVPRSR
ncbi:MAG: hypothetical protein NVS3B10_28970 [Polyangiales bacterium]